MLLSVTPKGQGGRIGSQVARRSNVSELDRQLARVAAKQHGVFSLAQARAAGISQSTLDKRVSRGALARVQPAVFAFPGAPASWKRDALALVLSVPGLAAASHKTAAFMWGLSSIQPVRTEIVTVRHQRIRREDAQVHESVDLEPGDVVTVDGIPTTTAVRTVVDAGATASSRYVENCLDSGLRIGLFSLSDVERFIERVAVSGRNGIGTIRPLVAERAGWDSVTESALEDLFRRLVAASGLPVPVAQYRVFEGSRIVCRADFAYPDHSILIELDGERYHMDREAFQLDRAKQNRAHALGWKVYRFTWRQLKDEPATVTSTLATALRF